MTILIGLVLLSSFSFFSKFSEIAILVFSRPKQNRWSDVWCLQEMMSNVRTFCRHMAVTVYNGKLRPYTARVLKWHPFRQKFQPRKRNLDLCQQNWRWMGGRKYSVDNLSWVWHTALLSPHIRPWPPRATPDIVSSNHHQGRQRQW